MGFFFAVKFRSTFYAFILKLHFFTFFCCVVLPGSQEHLSHSLHLTSVHLLKATEKQGIKEREREIDRHVERGKKGINESKIENEDRKGE